MGSHHPLGGSTGPGKKLSRFVLKNLLVKNKNNLAFHPGPVSPPGGDGSPLVTVKYFHTFIDRLGKSEVV